MSVETEIYAALAAIPQEVVIDGVYDTKLPENYQLAGTVLVFNSISDVPALPIDGEILGREQRWQVTVRALDLAAARDAREAAITALHKLRSGVVKWVEFESAQEFYTDEGMRKEYYFPLDFLVST